MILVSGVLVGELAQAICEDANAARKIDGY